MESNSEWSFAVKTDPCFVPWLTSWREIAAISWWMSSVAHLCSFSSLGSTLVLIHSFMLLVLKASVRLNSAIFSRQGFKCIDHGALPQSICSKATTLVMGVKRDSVLYVFFAMCSGSGSVSTETPDIAQFARP